MTANSRMESTLLDDLINEFIDKKEAENKSDFTTRSYRESYVRFAKFLDHTGLAREKGNLAPRVVANYAKYLLHDPEKSVKPASANHYLRDLRAFAYWCMDTKDVPAFPISMVVEQATVKEPYSVAEMGALLVRPKKTANYGEWRTWAIINWMLTTGNRPGTVVNVRIGDVDFENSRIYIRVTKTNEAAVFPLSKTLFGILKEFIRMWRHEAQADDFLFANVYGKQLTANAVKLAYTDYVHARELSNTSVYRARNTFAQEWVRSNGNVFKLQKMMIHKHISTTKRYVDLYSDDLAEGFEDHNALDKYLREHSKEHQVKRKP